MRNYTTQSHVNTVDVVLIGIDRPKPLYAILFNIGLFAS